MIKRRRRSAEESRARILEVAAEQLRELGPARLRLQAVGDALGITHAAVLHHFKSKEALIVAAVERELDQFHRELQAAAEGQDFDEAAPELIRRAFVGLRERGVAQLIAQLTLSGVTGIDLGQPLRNWAEILEGLLPPGDQEHARFVLMTLNLLALAEPVFGERVARDAGYEPEAIRERFLTWQIDQLIEIFDRPGRG